MRVSNFNRVDALRTRLEETADRLEADEPESEAPDVLREAALSLRELLQREGYAKADARIRGAAVRFQHDDEEVS